MCSGGGRGGRGWLDDGGEQGRRGREGGREGGGRGGGGGGERWKRETVIIMRSVGVVVVGWSSGGEGSGGVSGIENGIEEIRQFECHFVIVV